MADNPAMPQDLQGRSLRTLSDSELQVGETLLADAWTTILTQVPSVSGRLDALPLDTNFSNLVVQIECAMVLRRINNPDGHLEETVDDYSYRLDSTVSTGALYLTDSELDLLGQGDGSSSTAFTIQLPYSQAFYSTPRQWDPFQ